MMSLGLRVHVSSDMVEFHELGKLASFFHFVGRKNCMQPDSGGGGVISHEADNGSGMSSPCPIGWQGQARRIAGSGYNTVITMVVN